MRGAAPLPEADNLWDVGYLKKNLKDQELRAYDTRALTDIQSLLAQVVETFVDVDLVIADLYGEIISLRCWKCHATAGSSRYIKPRTKNPEHRIQSATSAAAPNPQPSQKNHDVKKRKEDSPLGTRGQDTKAPAKTKSASYMAAPNPQSSERNHHVEKRKDDSPSGTHGLDTKAPATTKSASYVAAPNPQPSDAGKATNSAPAPKVVAQKLPENLDKTPKRGGKK